VRDASTMSGQESRIADRNRVHLIPGNQKTSPSVGHPPLPRTVYVRPELGDNSRPIDYAQRAPVDHTIPGRYHRSR